MCLKTLAIEPFFNTWAKTTETGGIATQLTYIMALHHKCLSQSLKHLVRITARIRPHVCVSVSVCQWSPEIKDGGGGEIDRWSSWLRAVEGFLVISHVCFHEWESTDDVTRTIWTGAESAWNVQGPNTRRNSTSTLGLNTVVVFNFYVFHLYMTT